MSSSTTPATVGPCCEVRTPQQPPTREFPSCRNYFKKGGCPFAKRPWAAALPPWRIRWFSWNGTMRKPPCARRAERKPRPEFVCLQTVRHLFMDESRRARLQFSAEIFPWLFITREEETEDACVTTNAMVKRRGASFVQLRGTGGRQFEHADRPGKDGR